jgi:hypothetical protein
VPQGLLFMGDDPDDLAEVEAEIAQLKAEMGLQ